MNKSTQILATLLVGALSFNAYSKTFEFDPDMNGTFIDTDVLTTSMFPNDPVVVKQFFGADRLLNNGDGFSESFTYNDSTSTGSPDVMFPFPGLDFELTLTGSIAGVAYGAGIPDLADFDAGGASLATFFDDLSQTSFSTLFNTSAADTSVAMTMKYLGTTIGEFDLVAQVNTPAISLDGTTVNVAFILDFKFDQVWAAANMGTVNAVWRENGGGLIDVTSFTIQGQGSAGPDGTIAGVTSNLGVDTSAEFVGVNSQDNGSTFKSVVPEPTSIAILGLGLLGLAGARRRKA